MDKTVEIQIQSTPNPNAKKFILSVSVKDEGNSSYKSPQDCGENRLALSLFKIKGISQIHFFDNTITITKFGYQDWEYIEEDLLSTIQMEVPFHNSNYFDPDPEKERRDNLSKELKEIEAILDRTIRPGLQADGGDIITLSYEDHILLVRYQGACGTCPSSTTGTLEAIKHILKEEYDNNIEIYIAPEF